MAKFASTLADARKAATRSVSGKFTPTHKWEEDETKYMQFFVDFDEEAAEEAEEKGEEFDSGLRTLLMHRFIITGQREDGSKIYNDFISLRDPNLDGPEGYDPLIDRFGQQPSKRTIVRAAEVEPVYGKNEKGRKVIEDWTVATRQFKKGEETVEVPNIALIIESPHTFYAQMFNLVDMGETFEGIYAVRRSGKNTDTTYTFKYIDEPLDLTEEFEAFESEFDLDAWLEELANEDRMKELVDSLPDNAVVSKYPTKKKGEQKTRSGSSSTSSRSRRVEVEPDPDDDGEGDDPEPDVDIAADADVEPEAEEKPKTRARRFSDLKKPAKR